MWYNNEEFNPGGAPKAEPAARIRPADGNKDKTDTKNYAAARR